MLEEVARQISTANCTHGIPNIQEMFKSECRENYTVSLAEIWDFAPREHDNRGGTANNGSEFFESLEYQTHSYVSGFGMPPLRITCTPHTTFQIPDRGTSSFSEYSRSKIFRIFGIPDAQLVLGVKLAVSPTQLWRAPDTKSKILAWETGSFTTHSRVKIFWLFGIPGAQQSRGVCRATASSIMFSWYQILNFSLRSRIAFLTFARKNFLNIWDTRSTAFSRLLACDLFEYHVLLIPNPKFQPEKPCRFPNFRA